MSEFSINFVFPLYNESKRLDVSFKKIIEYFNDFNYKFNLIFVDDGSEDNTLTLLKRFSDNNSLSIKIISYAENKGKGYAIKKGLLYDLTADLYFFMDIDLSTPLEEINNFIDIYNNEKTDIIIGSRSLPDSDVLEHQPFYRELMGKTFNKIVKILILSDFIDTQCGFKLFTNSVVKKIVPLLKINRFAFDVEFLFLAKKNSFKIKEVPVKWFNDKSSKVHIFKDSIKMLIDIIKIRINYFIN